MWRWSIWCIGSIRKRRSTAAARTASLKSMSIAVIFGLTVATALTLVMVPTFYRAFFGLRGLATSKGFPSNAIFVFTNMLVKVLSSQV